MPPMQPVGSASQMTYDYYSKSCPQVEQLTGQEFRDSHISGPATIRLFFHFCFVHWCDASILIDTKLGCKELAQKNALDNKDLRPEGFETIDKAESLVEISSTSKAALIIKSRKGGVDGRISTASNMSANMKKPDSTIDHLITLFKTKGLRIEDAVTLSGAQTIGFAHCECFHGRLYNYSGTGRPDPYVDPRLLRSIKMSCPEHGGRET